MQNAGKRTAGLSEQPEISPRQAGCGSQKGCEAQAGCGSQKGCEAKAGCGAQRDCDANNCILESEWNKERGNGKQLGCSRKVTKEIATRSDAETGESPDENIARVCSSRGLNVNELQRGCRNLDRHYELNEYEIYVLCKQLKGEMGVALIDTGSQVSLVKLEAIRNKREIKHADEQIIIKGITGNNLKVIGKILLVLENASEPRKHEFYVVNSLPHELDMILGQDGLSTYGISLNIPFDIRVPAESETIVSLPTTEVGDRLIENQKLKEGVYIACGLVKCKDNRFQCLCVNVTNEEQVINVKPVLRKVPSKREWINHSKDPERIRKLDEKLRFSHIKEGTREIRAICHQFQDIFKLEGDKLTSARGVEHTIPTPGIPRGKAITLKNYRLPEKHKVEVEKQIQSMLEQDIITPSQSPWNFPLVIVPKKIDASGQRKWRICVDFRKLNDASIGDSFPIPNIQEILDKLGRARYFSALDCASGYWQVPIAEEDQGKTAFSTNTGHYEFKRMPFGLKSAPSTFQRLMNNVLSGTLGSRCLVYLDDIIIFGETLEEHNQKLIEVFQNLRECNLKIEPDKCEFIKTELQYLGHLVTPDGVKPDPEKIRAVRDFPIPKDIKDIKSFLGLAGYYRRFIDKFSTIAIPLTKLLKKDSKWKWEQEEQSSFDSLKKELTQAPVLQYPDFQQPFILTTDASNYAIGAILSQGKIGKDKPLAYASRTFNKAELNYSITEKELAAIVWACKHFRPYLLGTKFTIVTDHKALTWILNVTDPGSRLMRWRLLLEEYDYEVIHKAGKMNVNADALSRYPVVSCQVSVENRQRIIKEMHECPIGGHQGIKRTLERIKLYTSWPNMSNDVEKFIKACKTCQLNKVTQLPVKQPLIVTDIKEAPWEKIYLDIVGPLPLTIKGNKYILTCQDNLSKYLIAVPLSDSTAQETAKAFNNFIVCIFGIPNEIVTDQGSNFMSGLFQNLSKLLKIKKINTSAYHPESNGALERTHRTLVEYLRCFCKQPHNDWDDWLPFASFTYNTTVHTSTKYTPYEVLFGRKANLPGKLQANTTPLYTYDDIVQEIRFKFQVCHERVRENLRIQKEKQKEYYDEKRSRKREFKIRDQVLVKVEQRNKLEPLWKGPYEIQEVLNEGSDVVLQEVGKRKRLRVHVNRLKPYFVSEENSQDDRDLDT